MQVDARTQYLDLYRRETATTLKVLREFDATKPHFKPAEKSNTALNLAWTFNVEQGLVLMALNNAVDFTKGFPPAPATFGEAVAAYEASSKAVDEAMSSATDAQLAQEIDMPTGKNQMGKMRAIDIAWMMLLDSVHHRGQFSVYLRMNECRVPSIYGPSLDEPWR